MKILKYCLLIILAYSCILGCGSNVNKAPYNNSSSPIGRNKVVRSIKNKDSVISIIIQLENPADTFSVKVAPLKYNKDFAFSFTLDDGLVSAYLVAYPFFTGGRVSGHYYHFWRNDQGADGSTNPGLFYTDGSGNKIPFRASVAINAKYINTIGLIFHHTHLTWKQVKVLNSAGWDILNHSHDHSTGKNINAKYEVEENEKEVKVQTGIRMEDFVIPGGSDDSASNGLYSKAAFDSKMETVQCEDFGNYLIKIDSNLSLNHLKLGRLFMHSIMDTVDGKVSSILQLRSGRNPDFNRSPVQDEVYLFNRIDTLIHQKKEFWINAFTHSVGNQNLWNISMVFPQFRSFFNQLESRYGQNGADNIWMAPTQEVYEYLLNEKCIRYNSNLEGNAIIISINKDSLPESMRYHELTFLLNVRNKIRSIGCDGCYIESTSKKKNECMINIKWF